VILTLRAQSGRCSAPFGTFARVEAGPNLAKPGIPSRLKASTTVDDVECSCVTAGRRDRQVEDAVGRRKRC
jgi:hypothetical protein